MTSSYGLPGVSCDMTSSYVDVILGHSCEMAASMDNGPDPYFVFTYAITPSWL